MEKPTKEQIEKARENLKKEIAKASAEAEEIKNIEREFQLLKGKMESRWELKPLPPTPQEIKERELEEAALEYEKERKEREAKFDEQIQRKRPKAPGFEYS